MRGNVQQKDERLEIRVKPNDKKILEEAASSCGISLSSFVTLHSLKAAKDELQSNQIVLSKKDVEMLGSLIQNPPKPNAALKTLLAGFKKKPATKE
jgi:uncharacterized protein (DUF1778 family)